MAEKTAFLEVFPCCAGFENFCGGLKDAYLTGVIVDRETLSMKAEAFFARMPAPAELSMLEQTLRDEYALSAAEIRADYPKPEAPAPKKSAEANTAIPSRNSTATRAVSSAVQTAAK